MSTYSSDAYNKGICASGSHSRGTLIGNWFIELVLRESGDATGRASHGKCIETKNRIFALGYDECTKSPERIANKEDLMPTSDFNIISWQLKKKYGEDSIKENQSTDSVVSSDIFTDTTEQRDKFRDIFTVTGPATCPNLDTVIQFRSLVRQHCRDVCPVPGLGLVALRDLLERSADTSIPGLALLPSASISSVLESLGVELGPRDKVLIRQLLQPKEIHRKGFINVDHFMNILSIEKGSGIYRDILSCSENCQEVQDALAEYNKLQ